VYCKNFIRGSGIIFSSAGGFCGTIKLGNTEI
jgi:hypothetical protein